MTCTTLIRAIPLLVVLTATAYAVDPATDPAAAASPSADTPSADAAAKTPPPDPEQELARELKATIKGSEFVELQVGGKPVLALFQPQTKRKALGAVLLLHDLNGNPDLPGVIGPLRHLLPDAGWHSLSLQLSHTGASKTDLNQLDNSTPRIAAALAELKRRSILNVVIIGHGEGALAAIDYLANNPAPSVQGLIVIGLNGVENRDEPRLDGALGLEKINLPILDIYGVRDSPEVIRSAARRYQLARRNKDKSGMARLGYEDIAKKYDEEKGLSLHYRQIKVAGASHNFIGQSASLERRLRGWLNRYVAGSEIKTPKQETNQ